MLQSKLGVAVRILLLSSVLACSGGEASPIRGTRGSVVDSSAGTVALGLDNVTAYRPTAITNGGSLEGTVTIRPVLDSTVDSVVAVPRDQHICGATASVREMQASAGALSNALVWIDSIGMGKPLPEVRRDRLAIQKCRFEPRVMAVPVGTTINILSFDPTEHDARFYRESAGEPVERIRTFNSGSLVPSEKIAKEAGMIEVRSTRQPWARGYVAVFDHPYYAITDPSGAFKIDGLPPGTYTVKIWHEGLPKPAEQRVTVAPNGSGRLDVSIPLS